MLLSTFLLLHHIVFFFLIINYDLIYSYLSLSLSLSLSLYIYIYLMHSHLTLQMLQLADYHENALISVKPPKKPSIKERKQKLLAFLQGIYVSLNYQS